MKNLMFYATALILLGSCKALNQAGDQPQFEGTHWKLIALNQKPVEVNEQKFIEFKEAKATGRAACNTFSADYELRKNRVTFSNIIATKMYCDGVMDQENQIISGLQTITRFEIRYGLLYLYESNNLVLTYKK